MSTSEDETRADPSGAAGVRIDRYRLLQKLGEGGFGDVFLAEQLEPVRRQVALKVIKLGMDTRDVVARFEQERQALAIMDHPHIARVIDAGATEQGRPYFVMDLVKGEAITAFCDRHRLSIRDRLTLVEQVCHAVQHAHQKGLIHRDIKPSNILVSMQDGQPQPKVIDFGIAKATAARLTDRTVFTAQFQLIGTPEYMSPEQADGSLDIDTRSDVYSLGAVLYELVTGTTPLTSEELRGASIADVQRKLREVDPPSPSRRLSQSTATLPVLADKRATDPKRLSHAVHGELDWIIQKAIDKDRTRRYDTALGLALDIRRHLDGDAVLAVPPSTAYRMRKFVSRHRGAVAAATVITLALILGLVGTFWQASVATRERDAARIEAARAQAVTDFVVESLNTSDPTERGGRTDMTVAEAMQQAANRLNAGSLASEPEAVALLQRTIASVLNSASKSPEARGFAEQSVALERKLHGTTHVHVADALVILGRVVGLTGPFDEAESILTEAIQMRRTLMPSNDAALIEPLLDLLSAELRLSKFDELLRLSEEVLTLSRKYHPEGDRNTAHALNGLALANRNLGKLDVAEKCYVDALALSRRLFPGDHPDTATLLANIASVRRALRRYPEALDAANEALAMNRRIFPGDSLGTATVLIHLALIDNGRGKPAEAEAWARESLAMLRRLYPGDHGLTARALDNLADILLGAGKAADAQRASSEAVSMYQRAFKGDARDLVGSLQRLAAADAALEQWPMALTHARQAAEMAARLVPAGNPLRTTAEQKLADLERQTGGNKSR